MALSRLSFLAAGFVLVAVLSFTQSGVVDPASKPLPNPNPVVDQELG